MLDILCVGDVAEDSFLFLAKESAELFCDVKREECRIAFDFAAKIPVTEMVISPGGNAANVAVGMARLRHQVGLMSHVGRDGRGERVKRTLDREGVTLSYLLTDTGKVSNASTIITYGGERTIFIYHEPRDYRWPKRLQQTRWIYLTSLGAGSERLTDGVLHYQKQTKARLAFSPGTYQLKLDKVQLKRILAETDILFLNRQEAMQLLNRKRELSGQELILQLLALGPRQVVVTDGRAGAMATDGAYFYQIEVFNLRPRLEATGAGDSFACGVLAAIMAGHGMALALHWGMYESASVVQMIGAQAGLLSKRELEKVSAGHRGNCDRHLSVKALETR